MSSKLSVFIFIVVLLVAVYFVANYINRASQTDSPQFKGGKFVNGSGISGNNIRKLPSVLWRYAFESRVDATPSVPLTVKSINFDLPLSKEKVEITRLGHSSLMLNLAGELWLIDPVFSERTSPLSFYGPKRYHPLPFAISDLPEVSGIIISHDHYDHLDHQSILALKDKTNMFVVPLGVGKHLRAWGVDIGKIAELDWWEELSMKGVKLTATPAQHFSGRGIADSDTTLWASWVISVIDTRIFYSGDSGYFNGFKKIGERLGPFDLTMLENGAYDRDWSDIHMMPEETLQAHIDLRGKYLMPVHNGTFDLALHPWYEPFERLSGLAQSKKIDLITPVVGEVVDIKNLHTLPPSEKWWRESMPVEH